MLGAADVKLTAEASRDLAKLEASRRPEARSTAKRARALRHVLLADCLRGEVVRKKLIPEELQEKYLLENLYVEDLPGFWRLLYTVVRDAGQRYVVVVRIVDHRTYGQWFPGSKGH